MDQIYDLETVYDEQISPLMKKIIEFCKEHQMPMICSFAFKNCDERGVGACTTILNSFERREYDRFTNALKQIQGN